MLNVTRILSKIESGDRQAAAELLPVVYEELRKLATQRMSSERADHTLQATALVHEAYVRLVDVDQLQGWESRGHFFSAAAEAMRRILIDYARSKATQKRNAEFEDVEITGLQEEPQQLSAEDLLELDETLQKLEREEPMIGELVRLRVYAGLSLTEAAQVLGISRRTAFNYWDYALSWFTVEHNSQ